MRLLPLILAAAFLLAGIVFGALNPIDVVLDFYSWQVEVPLGVALIGACLGGALIAALVLWATVIWPQQRRIRAFGRDRRGTTALAPSTPTAFPEDP